MDILNQCRELIDLTNDDDELSEVLELTKLVMLKSQRVKEEKIPYDRNASNRILDYESESEEQDSSGGSNDTSEHSRSSKDPPKRRQPATESKMKQQREQELYSMEITLPSLEYDSKTFWSDVMDMSQKRFHRGPYDTTFRALTRKLTMDYQGYPPWLNRDANTREMFPRYLKACRRLAYIVTTVRNQFKNKNHFLNNLRSQELHRAIAKDLDLMEISTEFKKMTAEKGKQVFSHVCWQISRKLIEIYNRGETFKEAKDRERKTEQTGAGIKRRLTKFICSGPPDRRKQVKRTNRPTRI